MTAPTLPAVNSRYGAPLGRHGHDEGALLPGDRVYLRRLRLDSGGYDEGGAYWGHGQPIYWAYALDGALDITMRARTRDAVKAALLADYPGIKFFR